MLFHLIDESQYKRSFGTGDYIVDMMERAYIPSFSIVLAIMEEREWREYI
jgi:hypothetical protein